MVIIKYRDCHFSAVNDYQTDIGRHAKLATDDIGSSFMLSANEPSLALYRIQVCA